MRSFLGRQRSRPGPRTRSANIVASASRGLRSHAVPITAADQQLGRPPSATRRPARTASIVASASRGLRSHAVPTLRANLNRNNADKTRIANALATLVGVVQDFMAMSGYPLSSAVRTAVQTWGPRVGGSAWGAAMLAGAAAKAAVLRIPEAVLKFAVSMVFVFVVRPYRIAVSRASVDRVVVRFKNQLGRLLQGRDVDLRPVVSDLVMSFDAVDVKNMAHSVVQGLLQSYVYAPYVSSGGGGTMCTLCASAACGGGRSKKRAARVSGGSLAALAARAFKALNVLLGVHRTSLTASARRALDTYVFQYYLPSAARAVPGLGAQVLMGTVARFAAYGGVLSAQVLSLTGLDARVSAYLSRFGVDINAAALSRVLTSHAAAVMAFLKKDPRANIEPLLLDILKNANPMGATGGVVTAAVSGAGTSEFCQLCSKLYGACVRGVV